MPVCGVGQEGDNGVGDDGVRDDGAGDDGVGRWPAGKAGRAVSFRGGPGTSRGRCLD